MKNILLLLPLACITSCGYPDELEFIEDAMPITSEELMNSPGKYRHKWVKLTGEVESLSENNVTIKGSTNRKWYHLRKNIVCEMNSKGSWNVLLEPGYTIELTGYYFSRNPLSKTVFLRKCTDVQILHLPDNNPNQKTTKE